jgi:Tetracyclin repressor-like, C-terminal domain
VLGVIASFTLGLVSEQTGAGQRRVSPDQVIDIRRFPKLADMATLGPMTPDRYDAEFDVGLDFIVAGVEALLAARRGG